MVGLICPSLITNDKHPFKCLSAISLSLVKWLFIYFAHFSVGLSFYYWVLFCFVFLNYWVLKVLSVSRIQVLCQRFCRYFLWGCDLTFSFSLRWPPEEQRVYISVKSSWSVFLLWFIYFQCKKSWPKFANILPFVF